MTTKPVLVIAFVLLVIATFVVSILYFSGRLPISPIRQISQITQTKDQQPETGGQIRVPGLNEKLEEGIGAPVAIRNALPNSDSKVRTFVLNIENNTLNIHKIIVYENDVVSIKFTAVDKPYTLSFNSIGIKQTAGVGQTKLMEFQAVPVGTFPFLCEDCGKESDKTKGELIIIAGI